MALAREELGDVLVNVAMISQIESERGQFHFDDVAGAAAAKLVRRHPHVFGDQQAASAEPRVRSLGGDQATGEGRGRRARRR